MMAAETQTESGYTVEFIFKSNVKFQQTADALIDDVLYETRSPTSCALSATQQLAPATAKTLRRQRHTGRKRTSLAVLRIVSTAVFRIVRCRDANKYEVEQENSNTGKNAPHQRTLHGNGRDEQDGIRHREHPNLRRNRHPARLSERHDIALIDLARTDPFMESRRAARADEGRKKHQGRRRENRNEHPHHAKRKA